MSGRQTVYAVGSVGFLAAPGAILLYGIYHEPPAVLATSKAGETLTGWEALAIVILGCLCAAFLCWVNDGNNGGGWDPPDDDEPDPEPDPAEEKDLDQEFRKLTAEESDPWRAEAETPGQEPTRAT